MTLGQKVRQARIRAGLTQEQAAGGRITRNMLSLIENDLSAPSMKTLEYLAAALGVTAGWLLADDASDEAAERLPRARAMLREGDHRGCAALLEPGAEQASDEELLLLAVSAMELAEQALGAEQYEEAARRAEQALRWNARGLYAQQALSLRALAVLARCARGSENVEARIAEYREEYLRAGGCALSSAAGALSARAGAHSGGGAGDLVDRGAAGAEQGGISCAARADRGEKGAV